MGANYPGWLHCALCMADLPHPPTAWLRVVLLWACGVVAGLQLAKISVAFDGLQAHYGVSAASLGGVLSAMGAVGIFAGVGMGLLAPRWGLVRVLVAGLALGAMVSALQAALLPLSWLMATRVVEGLSHLAVVVSAPTLMVQSSAPGHRALVMGAWGTFVAVAYAAAGALAPRVLPLGLPLWLAGHAALMALAAVSVAWAMRGALSPSHPPLRPWRGLWQEHRALYTRLESVLPALCFFCYTSMALAFLTFFPLAAGVDRVWVAVALPLCGVAGTVLAGVAAQRGGQPLRQLQWAFGGMAVVAGLLVWRWLAGGAVAPWALLLMAGAGLAAGSALALVPSLNHDSAHQAQANGAVAQWGNVGAACAGPVFGWAWPHGAWGVGALVVLYCALGFGLARWGRRRLERARHNRAA